MTAKAVPLKTRRAVWERSGGRCECGQGCGLPANHLHHRKLRSQGGTNDASNLLHMNGQVCHERAHHNPAWGYEHGLLVHSYDDPAAIPVVAAEDVAS